MAGFHKITLKHELNTDFELTYSSLLDFHKFGQIHEYIKEVTPLSTDSALYKEYGVSEEIYLLGFIKNKPKYTVKVYEIIENKHIRYESAVKRNINLIIDFRFEQKSNNSQVVYETIQLEANLIVGKFFLGILKKAHLHFFRNLRRLDRTRIEDQS